MPIYEYQCRFCQHTQDELQKVSDAPLKKCEHCGKNGLERLVSSTSFQLKGTGWYETDFKGSKPKASDKNEATAEKAKAPPPKTSDTSE